MLKVHRDSKRFSKLDTPSLSEAEILERSDLQEFIFNSRNEFFSEIGERVFVFGKEVTPSATVLDRIDLLAVDAEGNTIIVELKRGSNKLQMLQAISYAGMLAQWEVDDFRKLVSEEQWEELTDFLDVDIDEINRSQRILLIAEGFDYALLAGAEWLSEQYAVDIRCFAVTLAMDAENESEYMACTSVFPPLALAEQAAERKRSSSSTRPMKWSNWDEAIEQIENPELQEYARRELALNPETYLRRRGIHYRLDGIRRWSFYCRYKTAYVWQRGRFEQDVEFWNKAFGGQAVVKPVKQGTALSMTLHSESEFNAFREAVTRELQGSVWFSVEELQEESIEGQVDGG